MLHPYFWSPSKRLGFLQDASDRFEIEERDPPSPLLQRLEQGAVDIIGPNWYKRIDRVVVENLGKYRKYDGSRVRDLLRALRNKVFIICLCIINCFKIFSILIEYLQILYRNIITKIFLIMLR